MRVLIVSNFFYPHTGGIEKNAFELARQLAAGGRSVQVVCCAGAGEKCGRQNIGQIGVRRAWTPFKYESAAISPLIFFDILFERFDAALIHEPNPVTSVLAWAACKIKRKPYFVTYHSDIYKKGGLAAPLKWAYVNLLQKPLILGGAKKIFATTPTYAYEVSEVLPAFKGKIAISPNGVDLQEFCQGIKDGALAGRLGLDGKKVVLFVGRLIPYKGVEVLLEAFGDVLKNVPDATLVIVGQGPLRARLEEKCRARGIEKSVVFAGRAPEGKLADYYRLADVFVLPSIYKTEAFGIVLLEAMACGVPCIGTDVSGTRHVLENAGIVVRAADAKALADAIGKVLLDRQLAKRLGQDGLARARGFEWKAALSPVLDEMKGIEAEKT